MSKMEKKISRLISLILCTIILFNFLCPIVLADENKAGSKGVATELSSSNPYDTIFNKGFLIKPGDNSMAINKEYASSAVVNLYGFPFKVEKTGLYHISVFDSNSNKRDIMYGVLKDSMLYEEEGTISQDTLQLYHFFRTSEDDHNYVSLAFAPISGATIRADSKSNLKSEMQPVTQPKLPIKEPTSTEIDVILLQDRWYFMFFQDSDFIAHTVFGRTVDVNINYTNAGNAKLAGSLGEESFYLNSNVSSAHITRRQHTAKIYNAVNESIQNIDGNGNEYGYASWTNDQVHEYLNSLGIIEDNTVVPSKGSWIEGAIGNGILILGEGILRLMEWALGFKGGALTLDKLIFNTMEGSNESTYYRPTIDLRPLGGAKIGAGEPYEGVLAKNAVREAVSMVYTGLKVIAIVIYIMVFIYIAIKILLSVGTKKQSNALKGLQYWMEGMVILNFAPYFFPIIPFVSNALCRSIKDAGIVQVTGQYSVTEIANAVGEIATSEDAGAVETKNILEKKIEALNKNRGSNYDTSISATENENTVQAEIKRICSYMLPENAQEFSNYISNKRDEISSASDPLSVNITTSNGDANKFYNMLSTEGKTAYKSSDYFKNNLQDLIGLTRDIAIENKIENLEGMINSLTGDPMVALKIRFKETDRAVFAIAWFILILQLISLVFMYYKRMIVVILLIILFPIVMAVYAIDKIGDGRSQSLKTWFQEFLANTTIQFVHALVYVALINIGIEICRLDPTRYWFFLFIAICSLFPAERILRGILGIKSTTLDSLKVNISGMILAGKAIQKTGSNAAKMGVNGVRSGYSGAKNFISNAKQNGTGYAFRQLGSSALKLAKDGLYGNDLKKIKEESEKKKKRKQNHRDSRAKNREYRMNAADDAINHIMEGNANFRDYVDVARGVSAKLAQAGADVSAKVRQSKIMQAGSKMATGAKVAGAKIKQGANAYKRFAGATYGLVNGMESMGDNGIESGIAVGRNQVHQLGGFKDQALKHIKKAQQTPTKIPGGYKPRSISESSGSRSSIGEEGMTAGDAVRPTSIGEEGMTAGDAVRPTSIGGIAGSAPTNAQRLARDGNAGGGVQTNEEINQAGDRRARRINAEREALNGSQQEPDVNIT